MGTTLVRRSNTGASRGEIPRGAAQIFAEIEVRSSPIHGKGVFATRRIRPHTLLGVYEGPRTKRNGTYVLWIEDDDGSPVGIIGRNELRYLNHSSKPNAVFWGPELFSLRSIAAGTEITFDYGDDWAHVD